MPRIDAQILCAIVSGQGLTAMQGCIDGSAAGRRARAASRVRPHGRGNQSDSVEQTMRSSSPQAGAPAPGQMPMSGVLGNASAAVSYGRAAIFGIRGDIRNLLTALPPRLSAPCRAGFWLSS